VLKESGDQGGENIFLKAGNWSGLRSAIGGECRRILIV